MKSSIDESVTIMQDVAIGNNVSIGKYTIIHPNVTIEDDVFIGAFCIIGEPASDYYNNTDHEFSATKIGKGSIIRSHTVIYEDVLIAEELQTGHHVTIRENSRIGRQCSVGTFSDLQGDLVIGDYSRLHSNVFVGQLARIDNYVWIYPHVVITNDPRPPMGNLVGSHICQFAQIAAGSIILPGVTVGVNSLVGAGSVVTKDVDTETVVVGVPAKKLCSIKDIKDEEGNSIYPWKDNLKQYRGYPWQDKGVY